MNPLHRNRSTILPLDGCLSRPLWSVMIPTHNCAKYLLYTLQSVLSQDLGPDMMQIEVIDDNSTLDDPESVVNEVGNGRVGFYRQRANVGHIRNFDTCLQRSRGKLIHLLHGDDCILDGFYSIMAHAFVSNPEIGSAFCRHIFMNEDGHWMTISDLLQQESGVLVNWLERIAFRQYIQTPSVVVRREVYEKLGGFDHRLSHCEDWEMWLRIATEYPVWFDATPLALYRVHDKSSTSRLRATGEDTRDWLKGVEIVKTYLYNYLPRPVANKLLSLNREEKALSVLQSVRGFLVAGEIKLASIQIREALRCSSSWKVLFRLAKVLFACTLLSCAGMQLLIRR